MALDDVCLYGEHVGMGELLVNSTNIFSFLDCLFHDVVEMDKEMALFCLMSLCSVIVSRDLYCF